MPERLECDMLKKFAVRNYKNFKDDISIDFENIAGYQFGMDCITDGMIGKALIYGRNATGKTNLGLALIDIWFAMVPIPRSIGDGLFLNADSTEDRATFSYTFQFGSQELVYQYARFSNQELSNEKLLIDGTLIFECDFDRQAYDFDNLDYIHAETANVERYLQSLDRGEEAGETEGYPIPFLRWLIGNVAFDNDSVLIRFSNYVRKMAILRGNRDMTRSPKRIYDNFYESLEKPEKLQDFQDFLNAMGIACRLELKQLPDGQRELYFAHEKLVPFFTNASSGTLALANLYRRIVSAIGDASFLYLDEFDAFYHYEMAENVIQFLKEKYPKCQMILTSHNTNLMTNRLMRPDCLFILSREGTLTPLCDATGRELREGHNLEKMYISGEFERYE